MNNYCVTESVPTFLCNSELCEQFMSLLKLCEHLFCYSIRMSICCMSPLCTVERMGTPPVSFKLHINVKYFPRYVLGKGKIPLSTPLRHFEDTM